MYATTKTFSGQRASLTRAVVIKTEDALFAGTIVAIDNDTPTIVITPSIPGGKAIRSLSFFEAKSEADLEAMPNNAWAWPPRV